MGRDTYKDYATKDAGKKEIPFLEKVFSFETASIDRSTEREKAPMTMVQTR